MKKILLAAISIFITLSNESYSQTSNEQEWQKYINIGFEFLIPDDENRPVIIGNKNNSLEQVFSDTKLYYLTKYQGENSEFKCSLSVVAYEETNVKEYSNKLLEMMKTQFEDIIHFELLSSSKQKIRNQWKIQTVYKTPRGTINSIIWLEEQRAIIIGIEDYSSNNTYTKYFEENFLFY